MDLVILSNSPEELQNKLNVWKQQLKEHEMQINIEKTEVLTIIRVPQSINIKIEYIDINQTLNIRDPLLMRKDQWNTKLLIV